MIEVKGKIVNVGEFPFRDVLARGLINHPGIEIDAGMNQPLLTRVPLSREQVQQAAKHLYERVTLRIEFQAAADLDRERLVPRPEDK